MALAAAILPALLATAGATTVTPMAVEELAQRSSAIVEAEVVESWSAWNQQRTRIYTYSKVRVFRSLKGGGGETLVVKQVGGSAGGYEMKVSGVRPLQRGEQALLFLRPTRPGESTWGIVGLMQGHFRVYSAGGRVLASNGVAGRRMRAQAGAARTAVGAMTLQELESRIQRALSQDH
jgi:hypothetical protein